ncbi:MAG: hypothetical protein AAGI15_06715 [Pseudomonadota bacterium]
MKYSAKTGTLSDVADSKSGIALLSLADARKVAARLKQQPLFDAAVGDF